MNNEMLLCKPFMQRWHIHVRASEYDAVKKLDYCKVSPDFNQYKDKKCAYFTMDFLNEFNIPHFAEVIS